MPRPKIADLEEKNRQLEEALRQSRAAHSSMFSVRVNTAVVDQFRTRARLNGRTIQAATEEALQDWINRQNEEPPLF